MTSEIYGWVRNITYFMIFMTVISNLLPDKKYEKYIRLFSGMVLILLVLKPLTGGLKLDQRLAYYFESISFQKEAGELQTELAGMEEKRLNRVTDQYQRAVASDIKSMAEEAGFAAGNVEVAIDGEADSESFGRIVQIEMTVRDHSGAPEEAGIGRIKRVEPVVIGGEGNSAAEQKESREQRREEYTKINALRRRIAEYYELEESGIEIQLEDGEG